MKIGQSKSPASHSKVSAHITYGVLITGGRSTEDLTATDHSAEIFLPHSPDTPCILPELPAPYFGHTQSGGLLCGGYRPRTNDSCRQWNSTEGKFLENPVHKISPGTFFHVSWTPASDNETFLLDGNVSTIVKPGVELGLEGFNLKYRLFSACSIPDPDTDTVVITGGRYSEKTTSVYNEYGFIEYLGDLNFKRYEHGCTSYVSENTRVTFFWSFLLIKKN